MFIDIIRDVEDIPRVQLMIYEQMAEHYENGLPDTLMLNHYELSEMYGHDPRDWDKFMKIDEIARQIELEIASIAEVGARKAIARLQSGRASSADISAAKEVLNASRLIKQRMNQKPIVVITRIPPKEDVNADG